MAHLNSLYLKANPDTNLKRLRKAAGLSQNALAEVSGVPLRTIQQYEQRQKNINKAQNEYLVMPAHVLYSQVSHLPERVSLENEQTVPDCAAAFFSLPFYPLPFEIPPEITERHLFF